MDSTKCIVNGMLSLLPNMRTPIIYYQFLNSQVPFSLRFSCVFMPFDSMMDLMFFVGLVVSSNYIIDGCTVYVSHSLLCCGVSLTISFLSLAKKLNISTLLQDDLTFMHTCPAEYSFIFLP